MYTLPDKNMRLILSDVDVVVDEGARRLYKDTPDDVIAVEILKVQYGPAIHDLVKDVREV